MDLVEVTETDDDRGGRGEPTTISTSRQQTRMGALPRAEDVAWLTGETRVETAGVAVPEVFSAPQQEFARRAVLQDRLLWSCHSAIDRHGATVWSLVRRGTIPVLVVCSAASISEWASAWTDNIRSSLPPGSQFATARYRTAAWDNQPDVRVISYGQLLRLETRALTALGRWAKAMVLDDSHKAREETTRSHEAVMHLIARLRPGTPLLALSTQPIANRLRELCQQLKLLGLDEGPLGDPARLSSLLAAYPNLVAAKLAASGAVLHHDLSSVRDYLPALTRKVVPVPIAVRQRNRALRFQAAFETFLTTGELDRDALMFPAESPDRTAPDRRLALRTGAELSTMLISAPRLDPLAKMDAALLLEDVRTAIASGKEQAALKIIRCELQDHPVLVLVEHCALGESLSSSLQVPFVQGLHRPAERRRLCQAFQDGEHDAIVVNMRLEALPPLTRAETLVVVELPWNQALLDRALHCVYRAGVDHDITVLMLTNEERGLEGFIRRLHVYKGIVAEAALRGIEPDDRVLVATLEEALAIEGAGLHPDDWFRGGGRGWLPRPAVNRLAPSHHASTVRSPGPLGPGLGWARAGGEWSSECVKCGTKLRAGRIVDRGAKTLICTACHKLEG